MENNVFTFRLCLSYDLANMAIPIYTNSYPEPWDEDFDEKKALTLDDIEDIVEKAYFTPERIKELKEALIEKIKGCENPFQYIQCCDLDGGYNIPEEKLFKIDWTKK